ncbi:hypothetical protein EYF80_039773 [Liparis tanakae]|uniref:Uncharacterized protein n=1 Tax=Liparis tanakae TaxID=230148 RepID=A0A4Z2GBM6_9TELE|nr:hypothetical protein EYF80_039773 [Liparis tanakae]
MSGRTTKEEVSDARPTRKRTGVHLRTCSTFAGVAVLLEVVALPAVALVGAVDVGTLLTARAGQTLVHIWGREVGARYRRRAEGSSVSPPEHGSGGTTAGWVGGGGGEVGWVGGGGGEVGSAAAALSSSLSLFSSSTVSAGEKEKYISLTPANRRIAKRPLGRLRPRVRGRAAAVRPGANR